ncbi:MAG: hypothetical protein QOF54_403 [Solirubrobacteraceae bacterium]|nr:hypothetical protein [Solirubrobacteraceae bacterium]
MSVPTKPARRRVPAAERREELIAAAVHEFAHGGLHGTPVERIARRVGVAQPYVFSLFPSKRDLFLAALQRGFERVAEAFRASAAAYGDGRGPDGADDVLDAMGRAYKQLLVSDRDYLMLQHQSYAACDDDVVRECVRRRSRRHTRRRRAGTSRRHARSRAAGRRETARACSETG